MPEVDKIIDFEIPKLSPSIIMVTGVGGGGSNAVNHMFEMEIADVSFMVCNTDPQALRNSPVPVKVRLGQNGLGAGNNPEKGRQAALESLDEIVEIYKREGTKMVFITAGMGGGTGTGAAPVIAKAARELGILTVAIVTIPFKTEGPKRMKQAYQGIDELRECVDSLLLIN
ncbi:cell division protein FtsZ, partial [Alistipes ihumii]